MKTYVIKIGFEVQFYPPLTSDQKKSLYEEYLFQPLRTRAEASNKELVIKEELGIVGSAIIQASEEAARLLRQLGFHLQIKKTA